MSGSARRSIQDADMKYNDFIGHDMYLSNSSVIMQLNVPIRMKLHMQNTTLLLQQN